MIVGGCLSMTKVLVIDDERNMRTFLDILLREDTTYSWQTMGGRGWSAIAENIPMSFFLI